MTNFLKSQRLNSIVNTSKGIYLCIFTVYLIVRLVPALHFYIDSLLITGFFFGMAALYIGYDILTNRFCFKTRYFPAAVIFLVITVISCIINYEYGIFSNIKGIAAIVIYLFLLYPESFSDKNQKIFSVCMNTAFFSIAAYSAASIPMYFFNIHYHTAAQKTQGFNLYSNRLWGIYEDPNYLALYSLIAILLSVLLFAKTKSIILKIVLILGDILHLSVISLSGSRMGLVCLIFASFWISFIFVIKKLKCKIIYRALILLLTTALSVCLPIAAVEGKNHGLPVVKKAVIHLGEADTYINVHKFYDALYKFGKIEIVSGLVEEVEIENFPFDDTSNPVDRLEENKDITNGRVARWLDGLKLLAEKPFFGLSPRNIFSFAEQSDVNTLMGEKNYSIHNTYLEILTGVGIFGGIFILGFLILAAIRVFKAALGANPNLKTIISTTVVAVIALAGILLPDIIFFQTTFAGLMFWLCLGNCLNSNPQSFQQSLTYKAYNKLFKKGN